MGNCCSSTKCAERFKDYCSWCYCCRCNGSNAPESARNFGSNVIFNKENIISLGLSNATDEADCKFLFFFDYLLFEKEEEAVSPLFK